MKYLIVISAVVIACTGGAAFALHKKIKEQVQLDAAIKALAASRKATQAIVMNPSGSVVITNRPSGRQYRVLCNSRFVVDALTEKSAIVWVEEQSFFQTDNVVEEFVKNCDMPPRDKMSVGFVSNVAQAEPFEKVRPDMFKILQSLAQLYETAIKEEEVSR